MGTSRRGATLIPVILFVQFALGSATGVQRTILSLYTETLTASALIAFLPIVSFGIFKGAMGFLGGVISDRIGRRYALILGGGLYLTGIGLVALLESLESLIAGNLLIGAGEGLNHIAAMAALSDVLGSEEAATSFGYMEGVVYAGYGVGAVAAGLLWRSYDLASAFYFAALGSASAFVATVLGMRETAGLMAAESRYRLEAKVSIAEGVRTCLRYPSIVATYATAHISEVVDVLLWALIPLYMRGLGVGVAEIGLIQGVEMFLWAFSMPLWGSLSDRMGRKSLVSLGLALNALAAMMFLYAENLIQAVLIAALMGLSYGMHYPILPALSVDLAPLGIKGTAIGLYRSLRDTGYFTGAVLLGLLLDYTGISNSFFVVTMLILISSTITLSITRETRPAWPFFHLVLEHVQKVRESILLHRSFLDRVFAGDVPRAEEIDGEIKLIEREADSLKRSIMGRIWSSTLPVGDRMDFERLVEVIDRVMGALLECDERLLRIDASNLPQIVGGYFLEMHERILNTATRFVENLGALRTSPVYALRLSDEVLEAEREVDAIRKELLRTLRRLLEEGRIDLMTALDLREAVDLLEMIADDFEDASDIVRIISHKHAY